MKEKYCINTHQSRFDTNEKCQDFLVQLRWQGGIPTCPVCGNNNMNYYLKTRKLYKCSSCRKQFSLIKGTIFERSQIPLKTWFMAIYIFTTKKRGISSVQLSKWLGVRQTTAWFMLHRLREALKEENDIVLSGIVEADEAMVGPKIYRDLRLKVAKRKHDFEQDAIHGLSQERKLKMRGFVSKNGRKKGSTKEVLAQKKFERDAKGEKFSFERGVIIFGMIERNGKLVMKKLGTSSKNINRGQIFPLLQKHITSNSVLITDQLNLYKGADKMFAEHHTVNHNIGYVVDGIHTNNIENAWKQLKATVIGTYTHISYEHFDRYLNENSYRWNRKNESEKFLFDDFMPLLFDKQVSYKKLINKDDKKAAA